jgi:hypothetical protein
MLHEYHVGAQQPAKGVVSQRRASRLRRISPYLIAAGLLLGILVAMLYPAVQQAREPARRSSCKCNLKGLGLALHNYHDAYGCFPPAYIADEQGRPMHSWRVLILPQLSLEELYKRYSFDEPWDGPNNVKLLDEIPPNYKCPSHSPRSAATAAVAPFFGVFACSTPGTVSSSARRRCTNYAAVLGPHCVFRGANPVTIKGITDGTSVTLMIGEVTDADILWTKPEDIDIAKHPKIGDRIGFSSDHYGGATFLIGDGSVRFLSDRLPQQTVDALYTRDGGEHVSDF